MSVLHNLGGLARPRRTVRLRLTALYGALFLASGAGLLAITNLLASGWPWPALVMGPDSGEPGGHVQPAPSPIPAWVRAEAAAQHAAALNQLLARAQHGASDDQETIPLGPLIASAIETRAGLVASMGLDVGHAADGSLVTGNPVLLAQMTGNLIDNAVRHNHPGGWIRAEVTRAGPTVRLLVENGGSVLSQDTVTSLTQPFRRLGTDRTGSTTGTGLGLSITEAIAAAHGGTLHLHARPDGGLRAVIDLPAASASPPVQLATAGATR